MTAHNPALRVRRSAKGALLRTWALPRVRNWIALSPRNAELLSATGIRRDRIRVIAPGLPSRRYAHQPSRAAARKTLALPDEAFVIGTTGRLARQKRHDLLPKAAAMNSSGGDVRVVIMGDGELRRETEDLANELLPGRAHFPGHRTDAVALLPAFDVFCLPSDYEGLSFSMLEAMATGLLIVATDVQGSGEALHDHGTGLLVRPGSAEALAHAIAELRGDPALAARLGAAARDRFEAAYTADRMIGRTIALYEEVAASRRS